MPRSAERSTPGGAGALRAWLLRRTFIQRLIALDRMKVKLDRLQTLAAITSEGIWLREEEAPHVRHNKAAAAFNAQKMFWMQSRRPIDKRGREMSVLDEIELESEAYALASEKDAYLHGKCHLFAIALNEITGWPLAAWLEEAEPGVCLIHAFVIPPGLPESHVVDLKGLRTRDVMMAEFCPEGWENWCQPVTRQALLEMGEGALKPEAVFEQDVWRQARALAEKVHVIATQQVALACASTPEKK